jgi:molybdopterin adenylyltransferase
MPLKTVGGQVVRGVVNTPLIFGSQGTARNLCVVMTASIGIITVSDRASRGEYEDRGGPAIREYLSEVLSCAWTPVPRIVPDEPAQLADVLKELCDEQNCCLVITTGGTGPARRDITPEATEAVCEKLLPGFGELMREVSLQKVPTAILSRQMAGVRGQSLIVNLPGQPRAIRECLDAVFPAIPYCIDLIEGPRLTTHEDRIQAYRPPGAKP